MELDNPEISPSKVPRQSEDEIMLLERVILRLASADSDEALTVALNKFLPPCLLKLSSNQEGVRKKVLELLVHVNKRVKDNPRVLLPVESLLVQYQDPSSSHFVYNFSVIYIKMGFPRLPIEKQAELIPGLLSALESKPIKQQDSLMLMMIPALDEIKAPNDEEKKKGFLGLSDKPKLRDYFLNFLLNYLLLPYGSHPSLRNRDNEEDASAAAARFHPCMSESDWKRVAGEAPILAEELEKNKVKILKFLGKGLIKESDMAILLIIGTSDTRHSVATQADNELRKFSGFLDWNDPLIVSRIYSLFLGTLTFAEKPAPKPENVRAPANTRIRLKLMPFLLKSEAAASKYMESIQVIFDLLFGQSGNSNPKLRTQALSFVHCVIDFCPPDRLNAIGAVLVSSLPKLIKEETSNPKLRASCYAAIGKLGKKQPDLVNKDLTVLQLMFDAIAKEDKETQMSVQEAMSMMATAFKAMPKENLKLVEALLASYIEREDEPQVRLIAVRYAGLIFPMNHEASRFILVLGCGDPKDDVANLARNLLLGPIFKLMQHKRDARIASNQLKIKEVDEVVPDFVGMLKYVLDKADLRMKSQEKVVIGDKTLAFTPKVYKEILNLLRQCLVASAGILPNEDYFTDQSVFAPQISQYLAGLEDKSLTQKYLEFVETLISAQIDVAQVFAFLQILGCTFRQNARSYANRINWFKSALNHTMDTIRDRMAHALGIVCAEISEKDFERAITELTRSLKDKTLEYQHGAILALGYCYGRRSLLKKANSGEKSKSLKANLEIIVKHLGNVTLNQGLMALAASQAIGELGRSGSLPLSGEGKLEIVNSLMAAVKNGKASMKVREQASLSLGLLCVGDEKFPHRMKIIKDVFEFAPEVKDVELSLTLGEALVFAAIGPLSPEGRDVWTVSEEDFKPEGLSKDYSDEYISHVLNDICKKMTRSTHPYVRQAACLWLLSLVKAGKDFDVIKDRLLEIQSTFMAFLGDNNDFVQDAASKGLALVYENSSKEQQDKMVKNLLGTLSEGNRQVQKVHEDTKIFEGDQAVKTPTGENLSTYKELCSLATDLNQPDLVFKFMNLHHNNAMWNSKKGAAFGFSSIAAKAGEQMAPYLPKIIPKLFRYQFDPNPKIQASMSTIWRSLVPESTKTVDKYLPQIMEEIVRNLNDNQWRVRESSCLALQDVLRGRILSDALETVGELWTKLFKVMDDIKESVRLTASKTAASLSRTCIKMCDPLQYGQKSSEAAVSAILPPLLEQGLSSTVAEVRSITINTIVKITKNAGPQLKPHLPILLPALLEATSEMESNEVNYLSVRLANDPGVQEKLDSARIASAKSSPMMECVNEVLPYVDEDALAKVVPRLIDLIKGNYGVSTKGSTAHFVTVLTHHCPLDLQKHVGKILAAFVSGLGDRNAAVRKCYASAIGHLMKAAKDTSLEKLFAKLRTWYMEKVDEAARHAVALTFDAVSRHNPDKMKSHGSQTMPLVFLAMHEETPKNNDQSSENIVHIWEEIWNENSPGTERGIQLYLKEILSLLTAGMESQQWKMRAQVARAMGKISQKLGNSVPSHCIKEMLFVLANGLFGRTWDGKEDLLTALGDICVHSKEVVGKVLDENESENAKNLTRAKLVECLLRECGKEKISYKIIALQTTGVIVRELSLPCFEELFEITFPVIKKVEKKQDEDGQESKEEKEDEDKDEDESEKLEVRRAIYDCLGHAWPESASLTKGVHSEKFLMPFLTSLRLRAEATTRPNQLAISRCISEVLPKLKLTSCKSRDLKQNVIVEITKLLSVIMAVPKSTQLRTEALKSLEMIVCVLNESKDPAMIEAFKEELGKSLDDVIKDVSSAVGVKITARSLRTAIEDLTKTEKTNE